MTPYDSTPAQVAGKEGKVSVSSSGASVKPADQPRDVLLGKSLRERAHELRREACGAWSDVVIPPHAGLDEAKCQYAAAVEGRLRNIIDELADLSGAGGAS